MGGLVMTPAGLQQKSLAVLAAIADMVAKGKQLTIAQDWGYGSATLIGQDGSHTHIGGDHGEAEEENLTMFISGLYDQLVNGRGLSWAASSNDPISIKQRLPTSDDLEPKTCYCWWFNIDNDTWLYGDASALGDPWCYWLPYYARPIPPGSWIEL